MAGGSTAVEARSIDMIPRGERHGHPRSQFTLWFGANAQITAIVDGALAVVFGADAFWAIVGLLVGNVLGGAVMALHSAQGPKLGLPQMISSRAQFGVYGAVIPLALVILMYVGFASTGTVLSGQAINLMLGVDTPAVGILIFGAATALLAILGYKYIHALGRIATVLGLAGFLYLTVAVVTKFDVTQVMMARGFEGPTFLTAVALGAGWQLTFGPYVADYSRYLPADTSERKTFWYTFAGSVGGAQWAMTLGALAGGLSAAKLGGDFLKNQVGYMGDLAGGGLIAVCIYLMRLHLPDDRHGQADGELPQRLRCLHVRRDHQYRRQPPRHCLQSRSDRVHRGGNRRQRPRRAVRQQGLPEPLQELRAPAAHGLHALVRDQPR